MSTKQDLPETNPTQKGKDSLPDRKRRMYDFLREHPVGVLSTVRPDGNPHGVVIYFSVDEALTVRFLTKKGTRKYDNLKHHNHIMLTIFDAQTQTTVQVSALAVEHEGATDINQAARQILTASIKTSRNGLPPIVKLQAGAFTSFVLEPVQIRMAIYARPKTGDYQDLFDTIESFELHD